MAAVPGTPSPFSLLWIPQDTIAFGVKADALSNQDVVIQIPYPHLPISLQLNIRLQTSKQRPISVLCLFAAGLAPSGGSQIQRGGWRWILAALLMLSGLPFLFLLQLSAVLARRDAGWGWSLFLTTNCKWFRGRTVTFFFCLFMYSIQSNIYRCTQL